jgi:hypothetical protein
VNPTVYSAREFSERLSSGRHFVMAVLDNSLVPLLGELPNGARAVARERLDPGGAGKRRGGAKAPRRGRSKPR